MKRKPKPEKPHKREPRKPFENGHPGYVSPAEREAARQRYEALNCKGK